MSARTLTNGERIGALKGFGYTASEAAFLSLAALHGGYFLRRQFALFRARPDGAAVTQLTQRVLALGHAHASTWRHNTQLYHLYSRSLYEALGEPDNRNRRAHEWLQTKNRVMCLDFVLEHANRRYLATEREKVDFFTDELGVEPGSLPRKRFRSRRDRAFSDRYFLDKYPLFTELEAANAPSRITFCFVDEGLVGLSRFENHLDLYRPLFKALANFHVIYVADRELHLDRARVMFERFQGPNGTKSTPSDGTERARVLDYFQLRRRYESRDFASFDRHQLIRLRDARQVFSTPEYEALYVAWQTNGDSVIDAESPDKMTTSRSLRGTFSVEVLPHDYALFGSFLPR